MENIFSSDDRFRFYQENGFLLVRDFFDPDQIVSLIHAVDRFKENTTEKALRHSGETRDNSSYEGDLEGTNGSGVVNFHTATLGRLAGIADEFKDTILSERTNLLLGNLLGGNKFTVHQTILFFGTPLTDPHPDLVTLDTRPSGQSCTIWLALDDVSDRNGGIYLCPNKTGERNEEEIQKSKNITEYLAEYSINFYKNRNILFTPVLKPGDFVVFAPTTPHGSHAPKWDKRRTGMQIILRKKSSTIWGAYKNRDHHDNKSETRVNEYFSVL